MPAGFMWETQTCRKEALGALENGAADVTTLTCTPGVVAGRVSRDSKSTAMPLPLIGVLLLQSSVQQSSMTDSKKHMV